LTGDVSRTFDITFDYRCPFARNAHEHVLAGLSAGAPWEVRFVPFSLSQTKLEADDPDRWEQERDSGLLALQVAVAVRDTQPEHFAAVHLGLFALRHDHGGDLRDEGAVRRVVVDAGADVDGAFDYVAAGKALATVREEHEASVADHDVFGVPTFVAGGRATFVRLMDRATEDGAASRDRIERVLSLLLDWPELNEFKHTSIPR
jgi:predicted DsbA family dithiol-disulfide isomerase